MDRDQHERRSGQLMELFRISTKLSLADLNIQDTKEIILHYFVHLTVYLSLIMFELLISYASSFHCGIGIT